MSPLPTRRTTPPTDDRRAAHPRENPGRGPVRARGPRNVGRRWRRRRRIRRARRRRPVCARGRCGGGRRGRGGRRRRGGRRGRRRRLVRELVVQVLDPPLDVLAVRRAGRPAQILLERANGLALVALALVRRRDDGQNGVDAAVDRIGVIEVADRLIVVRFVEILFATQKDRVGAVHVPLADFRGVAGRRVARRLLSEGGNRDGAPEYDDEKRLTDRPHHGALGPAPYHKLEGKRGTQGLAVGARASPRRRGPGVRTASGPPEGRYPSRPRAATGSLAGVQSRARPRRRANRGASARRGPSALSSRTCSGTWRARWWPRRSRPSGSRPRP